jgi:hypothetical protein
MGAPPPPTPPPGPTVCLPTANCRLARFSIFLEQSSSLLPATSQHGHSWHRAPLGPMAIYLFNVNTFFSFFRCSSFDKKEGVGLFYNWCSLTTPYSNVGSRVIEAGGTQQKTPLSTVLLFCVNSCCYADVAFHVPLLRHFLSCRDLVTDAFSG